MLERKFTVCGHEPVVPYFRESGGQDVLQIPPHKLEGFERAALPFLRIGVLVFEGDVRFGDLNNPTRGNGDTEDILREVVERIFAITDVFNVDYPVFLPDDRIGFQLSLFKLFHEDPSKHFSKGRSVDKEGFA